MGKKRMGCHGLPIQNFQLVSGFQPQERVTNCGSLDFFPILHLMLYRLDVLQILTTRFYKFLGTDNATLYQTIAICARLFVEVDLLKDLVECFPLRFNNKPDRWQAVMYEKPILYCTHCSRQGHDATTCWLEKNTKDDMNQDVGLLKDGKDGDSKI